MTKVYLKYEILLKNLHKSAKHIFFVPWRFQEPVYLTHSLRICSPLEARVFTFTRRTFIPLRIGKATYSDGYNALFDPLCKKE